MRCTVAIAVVVIICLLLSGSSAQTDSPRRLGIKLIRRAAPTSFLKEEKESGVVTSRREVRALESWYEWEIDTGDYDDTRRCNAHMIEEYGGVLQLNPTDQK